MSKQASRPPTEALEASAAVTSAPSTGRLRGGTLSWPAWGRQVRCDFVAPREMFKGLKSSSKSHNRSCHSRTGAHIGEWAAGPRRFVHRSCLTFDGKYCYFNVYGARRVPGRISRPALCNAARSAVVFSSLSSPTTVVLKLLDLPRWSVSACPCRCCTLVAGGGAAPRAGGGADIASIAAQHHVTTSEAVLYAC